MQAYRTKRAKEQLPIHRHQLWQSNASRQQDEFCWKSRTNALSYSTDYPSQMDHYREVTHTRCSCDTCSLLKAQEMDRYYSTKGQPPLYLTSWPMAMQPQPYKQGFQPVQVQAQYQEIRQPSHSRGIPLIFTMLPHPLPTAPSQILHPAGFLEPCTYPPTSEPVNLSTQPQGPALNSPNFLPTTPQKIPHPTGHPEAGSCPLSEIHDASPPTAFKTSPTLLSDGSVNRTPLRPGGFAYDHRDLPKIVAVHSLPSSPVNVREQLEAASLLPMGSKVPNVYMEELYDRNSDGSLPRSHQVCLENRYPTIEPKTDMVAGAENTRDPLEEKTEKINELQDNFKDQSNMILVKCEPVSPKFQSHESPKHDMTQQHNEVLADISFDQEKALQPKDDIDREMKIKTLFKRINAWQIDFNQETDDIKKRKILNLILERRAELEKLRLKRDLTNVPNPEELPTSGVKGNSDDKEVVDINAWDEDTIAVETTRTVFTNSDITATTASDVDSRIEYTKFAASQNMKIDDRGKSSKSTMESHSDHVKEPSVTMETGSDMRMSSTTTAMETENEVTSPQRTMETEIAMDPNIGEDKTTRVAMKRDSYNNTPGTDAVCANMISSPFHVASTASSVINTNTDVVYSTNASTTPSVSKDVTMTTLNTTTTDGDAMATDDSDPSSRNNSRNSSPSPDDFANTDFSISPETSLLLTMASPCHTNPSNVDKTTLLQPSTVLNVFDKVKLYDRRKTLGGQRDDTVFNEPEADEENCVENVEIRNSDSQSKDVNRILDENLNQIHEEPISSTKSEGLLNIVKDPFATTEIKRKKQAGYSKGSESDCDDVWTMELDETSQKAVFRRRWKRNGGPFDRKRSVLESQTVDGNEDKELIHGDEWFSISNPCSPSKKRAILELRVIENEDQNDDDDGEQIINKAFKILSGRLKRSIHSGQEHPSLLCPTDKSEPTEDLLASDLETAESPSKETSLYHQDGGVEELEASSEDDFEESMFILERSLQLRESKIQRLNEKKEQLLDELKRIKASTPISVTRDL